MRIYIILLLLSLTTYSQVKQSSIEMRSDVGGTVDIPIKLNNVLNIKFIVDTGASESSIPLYIVNTLIKTETILIEDKLEDKTYLLANGSTSTSRRVRLRKVKIGDFILEDVAFSVSDDVRSPLLIGQNILTQFKSVKFDYVNSRLIITK